VYKLHCTSHLLTSEASKTGFKAYWGLPQSSSEAGRRHQTYIVVGPHGGLWGLICYRLYAF